MILVAQDLTWGCKRCAAATSQVIPFANRKYSKNRCCHELTGNFERSFGSAADSSAKPGLRIVALAYIWALPSTKPAKAFLARWPPSSLAPSSHGQLPSAGVVCPSRARS